MIRYKSYESDRLILRPTTEEDAEFLFKLANTPKWLQYIGDRQIYSVADAKVYINERTVAQRERLGYSNFTLIEKKNHVKIGTCGLFDREGLDGIDIGFALLPEFEKQGFAYESSKVMLTAAGADFDLKEVGAITTVDNQSSRALLEKLDFKLIGTKILPDDDEELCLYKFSF